MKKQTITPKKSSTKKLAQGQLTAKEMTAMQEANRQLEIIRGVGMDFFN